LTNNVYMISYNCATAMGSIVT